MVKKILHIEGLAVFILALILFQQTQGNWLLFALLLFVPDVSMLGYLKNKKLGSWGYNIVHNYVLALLLLAMGWLIIENSLITQLGIILLAHVGLDRFLGYGLKYTTDFKHTHLQKV